MKKILLPVLIGCSIAFTSCGPSAEEKAAAEKATQDSIAAIAIEEAIKATEDSMMAAQAAVQKAMEDSLAMQTMRDSLEAMKKVMNKPKPKPKTPEEKKIEEVKKATQGRG